MEAAVSASSGGHHTLVIWLLLLVLHIPVVSATYWTVTSRLVTWSTATSGNASTVTWDIRTGATVLATPTLSAPMLTTSDLTIVYVYYSKEDIAETDLVPRPEVTAVPRTWTTWAMPTIYTAPAACDRPFTVTTMTTLGIPDEVTHLYTPTSLDSNVYGGGTQYTAYLETNVITKPETNNEVWLNYIRSCINPATTANQNNDQAVLHGQPDIPDICVGGLGCTNGRALVMAIVITFPSLFILGFIESWFWFTRSMKGLSSLRSGTICWILMTGWMLCLTRYEGAISNVEQDILRTQWAGSSGKLRLRSWWRWIFQHSRASQPPTSSIEANSPYSSSDYDRFIDFPEPKTLLIPGQVLHRGVPPSYSVHTNDRP